MSFQELVESVRESISLQKIKPLVIDVFNRVLSKENITNMFLRSAVKLTKFELMEKTFKILESEICAELQRHMELEIKMNFGPVLYMLSNNHESESNEAIKTLLNMISSMIDLTVKFSTKVLGISPHPFYVLPVVYHLLFRRDVVDEMYEMLLKEKETFLEQFTKHIIKRCTVTSDHLEAILEQLEDYRKRIDATDRRTREYLSNIQ